MNARGTHCLARPPHPGPLAPGCMAACCHYALASRISLTSTNGRGVMVRLAPRTRFTPRCGSRLASARTFAFPAGRSAEDRAGGRPRDLSVGSASRMTARRSPSVVTRLAISSRVIRPRPLARRRWASAVAHSAWPDRNVRSPEHAQQRGLADLLDALAPGVSRFPGWVRRRQSRPAASVRSAIPTARSCAAWRLAARELSGANTSGRRSGSRRSRIRCRDSPCP